MTQTNLAATIAEIKPLFLAGLAPRELRAVLEAGVSQSFKARDVIAHQGTPALRFYLLMRGRARYFFITSQGRKVLLRWLLGGDIIGGAAMLRGRHSYLIGSEMVRDGTVLSWDRAKMAELIQQYPVLLHNTLSVAFEYLDWYLTDHVALTFGSARQRVAAILERLASTLGNRVSHGTEIDVTNDELAYAANVTPFTVSRLLNEWQKEGTLRKRRGAIVLTPGAYFLNSVKPAIF